MQQNESEVLKTAGEQPAQKRLAVEALTVYPEVQRTPPTKKLVKEIADKLDLSALGTFHVSAREDGTYSVMDGQRRKLALQMRGMGSYKVNCLVYTGLSIKQEARLFRLLNHSRLVGAYDDFSKGVVEGDPRDVGITKILEKRQWRVALGASPGAAACVSALRKVWDYDKNGALLGRVVSTLDEAFGRDKNTMASSLVEGMGKFLAKDGVDQAALIDKLKAKFVSPVSVVTTARTRQESERGTLLQNVAAVIERVYAHRRRPTR